jgi:hypothetical protein
MHQIQKNLKFLWWAFFELINSLNSLYSSFRLPKLYFSSILWLVFDNKKLCDFVLLQCRELVIHNLLGTKSSYYSFCIFVPEKRRRISLNQYQILICTSYPGQWYHWSCCWISCCWCCSRCWYVTLSEKNWTKRLTQLILWTAGMFLFLFLRWRKRRRGLLIEVEEPDYVQVLFIFITLFCHLYF